MRSSIVLALVVVSSCSDPQAAPIHAQVERPAVVPERPPAAPALPESAAAAGTERPRTRQTDGPNATGDAIVYVDGAASTSVTAEEAAARGLTIVDLTDGWLPFVLAEQAALGPVGAQPYAATYRALADERWRDAPDAERAAQDRFLELYGIDPNFRVVAARLADEARHACHDAVDDTALSQRSTVLRPDRETLSARRRLVAIYDLYAGKLARAERDGVAADAREIRDARLRMAQVAPGVEPTLAVQAHLRCDGLLSRHAARGIFDNATMLALKTWQREQFVVGVGVVDEETRALLVMDSHELDFRVLLRALRERVVDATGLVEDGSAQNAWGTVLGRDLDAHEMNAVGAQQPALANGAPDLISPATEAAAQALGWTSPAAAHAFFTHLDGAAQRDLRVALQLPPPPAWHSPRMRLRAVIDRGDVWYDYPYDDHGMPREQPVVRRPTLVLYAGEGDGETALVRFATTIGGWKPEQLPGGRLALRYKESEPGPRVWREIVATPRWMPPDETPDDELVHRAGSRGYGLTRDLIGPSYASAYGLVMLIQDKVVPGENGGPPTYFDRLIRTHGSVSYGTILHGQSHGCHRLFNHLAIRLASFLLAHREHVRRGPSDEVYDRTVLSHGHTFDLRIPTRGMTWELTPPVPVLVQTGNVLGEQRVPIRGARPLATTLAARAAAASSDD